ncbi:Dihydroorotate dehydrogenase-domain-containing protein [Multifurca ochricompacta]|uniref:Dihydroorotate dehydrogenase (quinone), mitochondrial n=1 Tax=Multifurca ochricompacta TaxID=376703 RepID=A0AAD4QJF8_9AGAM|nr:Dihydroorotate dehydrogenase-domain-containing protein [Multifurca ochricompacta]
MAFLRLATRRLRLIPHPHSSRNFTSNSQPISNLRTAAYVTLFTLTTGLGAVYYFDSRAAIHRYLIAPVIRYALDPETSHQLAVTVLENGLGPRDMLPDDERLKTEVTMLLPPNPLYGATLIDCNMLALGSTLSNPIGLAAGFDKDGRAIDGLFNLGFGWVEVGSVTPKPQPGNPRPRLFHLPEDSALINRYGFPSQGHTSVLSRLRARLPAFLTTTEQVSPSLHHDRLLAVNLGKNKESPQESPDDFIVGVRVFAPHADVLVVNVSSPNTPGLRGLQQRDLLANLLRGVVHARDEATQSSSSSSSSSSPRRPKLVLKISPDLDSRGLDDIADAIVSVKGIDGVIVTNTTVQRPIHLRSTNRAEQGGLSGAPLQPLALETIRGLRKRLPAEIPIIGCGGISSGLDALTFARAGASSVQIYTAFGYDGPGTCRRIKDELADELARSGTTWQAVVERAVGENAARVPMMKEKTEVETERETTVGGVRQLVEQAEN